jgi:hypothetical protein
MTAMKGLSNANFCKLRSEKRENRRPKSLSVDTRAMISGQKIIRKIIWSKIIIQENNQLKGVGDWIGLIGWNKNAKNAQNCYKH